MDMVDRSLWKMEKLSGKNCKLQQQSAECGAVAGVEQTHLIDLKLSTSPRWALLDASLSPP